MLYVLRICPLQFGPDVTRDGNKALWQAESADYKTADATRSVTWWRSHGGRDGRVLTGPDIPRAQIQAALRRLLDNWSCWRIRVSKGTPVRLSWPQSKICSLSRYCYNSVTQVVLHRHSVLWIHTVESKVHLGVKSFTQGISFQNTPC